MSRQLEWQLRQFAAGKCRICGKPRAVKPDGTLAGQCARHMVLQREYQRRTDKAKRRNNSLSYNLQ